VHSGEHYNLQLRNLSFAFWLCHRTASKTSSTVQKFFASIPTFAKKTSTLSISDWGMPIADFDTEILD
jgi:hypothetical protein